MNVGELREVLAEFDQSLPVMIRDSTTSECGCCGSYSCSEVEDAQETTEFVRDYSLSSPTFMKDKQIRVVRLTDY